MPRLTPEQREQRRRGIGSSDIAALVGLDPHRTALDVWLDKRGLLEEEREESEASLMGHLLEPVVAHRYQLANPDVTLTEGSTVIGAEPHFVATPDRIANTWIDGPEVAEVEREWIVEIKTRSRWTAREFGPPGTDEVPPEVLAQVIWQQVCTGLTHTAEVALLVDGRNFALYSVPYDTEVAVTLQEEADRFWKHNVIGGAEPPLSGQRVREYLRDKFREVRGEPLQADDHAEKLLQLLAQAKDTKKIAEAAIASTEVELMQIIGHAPGLIGATGKLSYSLTKGRKKVDWEAIVEEMNVPADLIAKHTTIGQPYRVMRFTPSKERADDE